MLPLQLVLSNSLSESRIEFNSKAFDGTKLHFKGKYNEVLKNALIHHQIMFSLVKLRPRVRGSPLINHPNLARPCCCSLFIDLINFDFITQTSHFFTSTAEQTTLKPNIVSCLSFVTTFCATSKT